MGKVAVVTGATSGFGRVFSRKLASQGYDLIIVGRREDIISKVAEDIKKEYKIKVDVNIFDLTDKDRLNDFISKLEERNDIEFLVNNAGHGADDSFTEDKYENQEGMINVHILAAVKLCHVVAKQMKRNKKGFIINLSSLASFNVFPTSAMYCATKCFLTSFSQSLAMELNKYNIRVQALCPGFARTDFHSKLDMDESTLKSKGIIRWMTAEEVVDVSLKNIEKELKVIVIPGFFNKLIYQLLKVIPKKVYYKVASKGWDLL
ncbi:SDR family NAD(P)-dependent oxidoreductase [Clostridium paraputrificum]|uniref:SDR family NAD(P)-dependent oxidoreductase n=1 Tax=Clostridium TaxID=1485 RepID=UPI003D328587